jgi:LmbE family N-acetylglucosaminyl deacetylase
MFAELSEDKEVAAYSQKFAEVSGLEGSANLQVRKSREGVRLLEVNPRFSSLVAVRAACGFRDAEWSVRLAVGQALGDPPVRYKTVRFERFLQESLDFGQGPRSVTEWMPKKTQNLTNHQGTVLVIAAHPDDEILGCGGTMARLLAQGQDVKIAILGEGMTSRYRKREDADRCLLTNLREHSRRAADVLGVKDLFLYDLPDNRFDTIPMLDVVKIVEELVQKHSPHTIFTHGCADLNVDHSITHRAVLTATRPIEGHCVRNLYVFEIPSSTDWSFHRMTPSFQPNTFFNIESTLEAKKRAMACYETEVQDFPPPRSLVGLEVVARRWGTVVGCEAAEAFELVRSVVHV